ncbi:apolipoprotein C-III [Sarcophilus harrisii]|uniref:Apolipoprotein C-III n=1 Tax=Sarcophilus harrisii TaxID=9305 RepID=A0A7N4NWF6_SARHA|nr:apolipoprotein C-III [Sarcophilus harrisii]
MRRQVLFAAVFLTLLVFAHADAQEEEEETILNRVHDYMQQAARQAQEALTTVQESQMAQQAKGWMADSFSSLHEYWSTWADKLSVLWDTAEKAEAEST